MTNKTLAIGIFISLGLSIFTAFLGSSMTYGLQDGLYTIAGFGLLLFGIWGGVRLYKTN